MNLNSKWKGWAYIGFFVLLWMVVGIAMPGYSEMTKQRRGEIGLGVSVFCLAGVIRGIWYLRKRSS